jgi:indolepyruvate ferredoxin oxidoreductase alpha subunit
MLGNEAIARGLIEQGCAVATSYPGTPASEILSGIVRWKKELSLPLHAEWAINEKVAFEIAYAGSMTGLRTAVSMKQVGLNVASDPLVSAAYMGVKGGFIVISADDPGPHSSQTEQDSRLMAMFARVPVLDPANPRQAKDLIPVAYGLSEAFEIPVMLRPTTRVCHASQDIETGDVALLGRKAAFERDPTRWAATPKFRHKLHLRLKEKLTAIASYAQTAPLCLNPGVKTTKAIVASGAASAYTREVLGDLGLLKEIALYQVLQPYPLHTDFIAMVLSAYDEILVIEETAGVIEMQLADRTRVRGKLTNTVPDVGELLPETIEALVADFAGIQAPQIPSPPAGAGRRPSLCPGCPHRASFFAIKKAAPRAIYASDIGCYTLGLNMGAIDTALCMGASISKAAGFSYAYRTTHPQTEGSGDIVATIGDSTFFHAGIPPLIDAVVQDARFVLVILDNSTTAMTGNQPTPALGRGAGGEPTTTVGIEGLVRACGVTFCRVGNPYRLPDFTGLVKEALDHSRTKGIAVVISRYPCIMSRDTGGRLPGVKVLIDEECDGCEYCVKHFECPAIEFDREQKKARINYLLCTDCGICLHACPKKMIREKNT